MNDKPIRWTDKTDDGRKLVIYRASAIGGCERAFVAAAHGMIAKPPPEKMQEIFDEGHDAEPQILAMWEEAGGMVVAGSSQRELELTIIDDDDLRVVVRGHVDALSDDGILECKKFRDSTWKDWLSRGVEVHPTYPWQVAALMHAWQEREGEYPLVTMLGGRWSDGRVVEIAPQYIANPPIPLRAFKKKIARIERLVDEGYTPTDAEVKCTGSYPCPYWYLHDDQLAGGGGAKEKPAPVKIRQVPDEIAALLASDVSFKTQLKMLEDDAKKIKAKRDAGRVKITEWLAAQGVAAGGSAVGGGYVIEHVRREVKGYEVKPRVDEYLTVGFEKQAGDKATREKNESKETDE